MPHFFSIIIPIYNAEKYLKKAVDSVLNQTEKDFELILVDNASTDGSTAIIDGYVKDNPTVDIKKVTVNPNRRISGGRNAGLKEATGKFICLLDADDYWYPRKLEFIKKAINENPECTVFWHWEDHISDDGKRVAKYRQVDNSNPFEDLLYSGDSLSPSATVIERKSLEAVGGFDETRNGGEEDYDCWLRLSKNGAKFHVVKEVLGVWLIRGDSVSASSLKHDDTVSGMLEDHLKYLKENTTLQNYRRIEKRVHARSLYIRGVDLKNIGKKKEAIQEFKQSIKTDRAYWKSYVRIPMTLLFG